LQRIIREPDISTDGAELFHRVRRSGLNVDGKAVR